MTHLTQTLHTIEAIEARHNELMARLQQPVGPQETSLSASSPHQTDDISSIPQSNDSQARALTPNPQAELRALALDSEQIRQQMLLSLSHSQLPTQPTLPLLWLWVALLSLASGAIGGAAVLFLFLRSSSS